MYKIKTAYNTEMYVYTNNAKDMRISKCLKRDKAKDVRESCLIKKIINKKDVVIDIGAHIGYFTLIMAKEVGRKGRVYAIEPEPENLKLLRANIKLNKLKNTIIISKAVSNKKRETKLYYTAEGAGDQRIYSIKEQKSFIKVNTIVLDKYFKDKKIDFIKIDAQGAEGLIFEGAMEILKKNENIKIVSEFYPKWIRKTGINPIKTLEKLKELGFNFYRLNKTSININEIIEESHDAFDIFITRENDFFKI